MIILRPYIGVTGFMSQEEVQNFLGITGIFDYGNRMVMIGILASQKTLIGQQAGNPNRYPAIDKIAEIFPRKSVGLLNLVHYNTSEPGTLFDQMKKLIDVAGPNCDGLQLNMYWPNCSVLENFRREYPMKQIVLQVGKKSLQAIPSPDTLTLKVKDYLGLIDYVLLDPSEGTGRSFDLDLMCLYLGHLSVFADKIGFGVAGGLSPDDLEPCRKLLENFPYLSFDVESGVRNRDDTLNVISASLYVERLLEMMK